MLVFPLSARMINCWQWKFDIEAGEDDALLTSVYKEHSLNTCFLCWFQFETPCPTEYQQENSKFKDFDTDKKPFLVGADRFPIYKRDIVDVLPG